MNLRRLDLNLLVALDALLRTRHVTRAGQALGIGQPGMSAALARLRQVFGDDLLVKQGSEMRPTALALDLEPELRRVLREIERLVSDRERFVPGDSRRSFTVRMSDLLSLLILPGVAERLSRAAPRDRPRNRAPVARGDIGRPGDQPGRHGGQHRPRDPEIDRGGNAA